MKTKLYSIFFLLLLSVPLASTLSFLHIQRRVIRKRVKHTIIAGIPKEELVLLKFTEEETKSKLKWKHEKEFEFEGNMYDIVESIAMDKQIWYWCWSDDEETQLNKKLEALLPSALGNDTKNQQKNNLLIQFSKQLFCSGLEVSTDFSSVIRKFISPPTKKLHHLNLSPPSPPPQLFLS